MTARRLLCLTLSTLLPLLTMAAFTDQELFEDADTTTGDPSMAVARAAEVKALGWVMSRMGPDYGWGEDTAHTTLAVALTNASWALDQSNLEAQLMAKQFELELVLRLWKHRETPMTSGHIALNILALVALCKDPRSFHGKNLVSMLEHHETVVPFEKAFGLLASCSAGKKIHKRNIRELLDIIQNQRGLHSVDTMSVVVLALQCAQKSRNRDLGRYIEEAMAILLLAQKEDGSFNGNLHSTALALQAMLSSQLGASWNATLSQQYLVGHQRADGSFGGLFDTNAVMPLLAGRTLLGVTDQPCLMQPHHLSSNALLWQDMAEPPYESFLEDELSEQMLQETEEHVTAAPPKMINITYIIWIGNSAEQHYNMTMTVKQNTSFYEIMKMAAETDSKFQFGARKFTTGFYVHTINGQKEKDAGFWYWLLYRLKEPPVPGTKPDNSLVNPGGVVETYPADGDYMLFWYHKI